MTTNGWSGSWCQCWCWCWYLLVYVLVHMQTYVKSYPMGFNRQAIRQWQCQRWCQTNDICMKHSIICSSKGARLSRWSICTPWVSESSDVIYHLRSGSSQETLSPTQTRGRQKGGAPCLVSAATRLCVNTYVQAHVSECLESEHILMYKKIVIINLQVCLNTMKNYMSAYIFMLV